MPELPEVEVVVRSLARSLTGRRIVSVEILKQKTVAQSPAAPSCLIGRRIQHVFRRGKFIRLELEGGVAAAIHLRMTGWLGILPKDRISAQMRPHVRVLLGLNGGSEVLVFHDLRIFGRIWCGSRQQIEALPELTKLGPEPLELSAAAFADRLTARRGALKPLLLDQRFLAGVGNIYADEALFLSKLHPRTRAERVTRAQALKLHGTIRRVLKRSIDAGGTTIINFRHPEGEPGWFQRKLLVRDREGQPCRRCGARIVRTVVGQRGTWYCPRCQRQN